MILSENREDELRKFVIKIWLNIFRILNYFGFGYYGGSLFIVEVLVVFYGEIMLMILEIFVLWDRDYFVLFKGYVGLVLYSIFYLNGFFDKEFLYFLNINGIKLLFYFDRNLMLGIDMIIGFLG